MNAGAAGRGVPLHIRCRDQRRLLGMSQQALADQAAVKQSALSAFERRGSAAQALSAEKVRQVAEALGVRFDEGELGPSAVAGGMGLFYCPNPDCPSAVVYEVGGDTVYRPRFVRSEAEQVLYCPDCGEVCESRCPGCRTPVSESLRGAFCPECGRPLIPKDDGVDAGDLARREAMHRALAGGMVVAEYRHTRTRQPEAG